MLDLRSTAPLWLTACALVTACNIGEGLQDLGDSLLDPDAALLDRPGRKLVAGKYSNLILDGSLEKGGYVLALRHDTPDQRLAIVPFLKGDPCEVGSALAFERLSSRVDVALSGLVAVQVSGNLGERGTIRFVGFDCEERMAALDDATLPRIEFPSNAPRGLLTLTGDKTLYLANAETRELELVSNNVALARVDNNRLWTSEGGQLVIRNSQLDIDATVGEDLIDFTVTGGTDPEVVFQDKKGLHAWGKKDGVRTLTEDGCGAVALDVATIAYYSPCATRRLMIEFPGTKIGSAEERVTLTGPENVIALPATLVSYGLDTKLTRISMVASSDAQSTTGQLLVAELDPKDLPDGATIELSPRAFGDSVTLLGGIIYQGWDGTSGDVMDFAFDASDHATGLDLVAQGVAQLPGGSPFSGRGALVRFDKGVGDLVQLTMNGSKVEEVLIAKGVAVQNQTVDKDGNTMGFVSNLKDSAGQVVLFDGIDATVIAERGYPSSLRFLDQPNALSYLAPSKTAGRTELHAYLTDSGLDLLIHGWVSEYRVVPWPSPGILYAVPDGKDAGLWFSKAH